MLAKELFDETTEMLGSTTDNVERTFTHEVGHLYDRDIGNFSDNSDLFFPDGELHAELKSTLARRQMQKTGLATRSTLSVIRSGNCMLRISHFSITTRS